MAVFSIKSFGGVSPKTPPRYLQDTQAQVAVNCPVFSGPLVSLANVTATPIVTLPNPGTPLTIYRYGQDVTVDERYWFAWPQTVDVSRGQIAGDPLEWTFYTGDGIPKATYNDIALAGTTLPAASIPLGVPRPGAALDATPDATFDNTEEFAAELTLDNVAVEAITTAGLEISLDGGTNYTVVALPDLQDTGRAAYITTRINAAGIAATATVTDVTNVTIKTTVLGSAASLLVRLIRGSSTEFDTAQTFNYTSGFDKSNTATGLQNPIYLFKSEQWGLLGVGSVNTRLRLWATKPTANEYQLLLDKTITTPFSTAQQVVDYLNTAANWIGGIVRLQAQAIGTTVVLQAQPNSFGASTASFPGRIRAAINSLDSAEKAQANSATAELPGATAFSYSYVFLTQAEFEQYIKGKFVSVTLNGQETVTRINDEQSLFFTLPFGCYATSIATDNSAVILRTSATQGSSLRLRAGTYPTKTSNSYFTLSAVGSQNESSVAETRVYTYTWVSRIAEREFESAPADPSLAVDVFDGQSVRLSKFQLPAQKTDGYYVNDIYRVTARRIYRAVAGVYLFVDEIGVDSSEYIDTKAPDDLSEELRTANWSTPPAALTGLINLPNGMMAGFVGRDVYFCEPYHPHAWPQDYVQTLDFPVVGLGRMDTTLAVLTTGNPYFIQGSHPDSMVVVKSDIQQACASKRSIVSFGGMVLYASPDGLVMLSSAGSKVITENMFTRAQWQELEPTSMHAYQHDMKYIAFYDTGVVRGGFVFDMTSGQFIFHDVYALAGYSDLQRDQLFLTFEDKSIRRWLDGPNMTYTWRSKRFTMPQVMGFACAQIEAEAYPVTATFYCDDFVTPYFTQTVTSRAPFRLPVKVGRDWEVQLTGTAEVFAISIAQSMEELANA